MTYDTCSCLYRKSLKLPFFFINDVFITGFCAESCGIERRHYGKGFSPVAKTVEDITSSDIVIHYMGEKEKQLAFQKLQRIGTEKMNTSDQPNPVMYWEHSPMV